MTEKQNSNAAPTAQPRGSTVQALQRLAQTRDPEAWGLLVEGHGTAMLQACRGILRDPALAEDACQEALLQLRDRAGQFRALGENPEAAARGWIMRLACNTALQMLRMRNTARKSEAQHMQAREAQSPAPPAEGSEAAMHAERAAEVNRELAQMSERERLPIVLHYHGGLGYEELAATLGCPVGTAKARVSRTVEKLRQRLAFLGLVLTFVEVSAVLGSGRAEASEMGSAASGASGAVSAADAARIAEWKSLLESSRQPAFDALASQKGLSTMQKIGIGVAVLLAAALLLFTGLNGNSAEDPQPLDAVRGDPGTAPAPAKPLTDPNVPIAPAAPASAAEKKQAADDSVKFACDLYAKLSEKKDADGQVGNLFFSPYSVWTALAMTYAGASGNTAAEMQKALHFTLGQERLHPAVGALLAAQNPGPNAPKRAYVLNVVNRLWGQKGYPFRKTFLDLNQTHYGAGLELVDFTTQAEVERVKINKWVEQQTNEKIKDLIPPKFLDESSRLVLTNAIYYLGSWEHPFFKEYVHNEPFMLANGKQVQVPLMSQSGGMAWMAETGKFQMVELPYKGNELSMLLLVPAKGVEVTAIEKELTPANLTQWIGKLKRGQVELYLPKFKLSWAGEISPQLKSLGMQDAFKPGIADFTSMADTRELFVSVVLHKAFVAVDEKGTEAAAATAVIMKPGGMPHFDATIRADHPFLFLIREKATGNVLFMGRVMEPKQEAE